MSYNTIDDMPIHAKEPKEIDLSLEDAGAKDVEMTTCPICQRSFGVERFAKHFTVCERRGSGVRRIFESYKHRMVKMGNRMLAVDPVRPEDIKGTVKKTNWRQQHQALIKQVRQARKIWALFKSGSPLPPALPEPVPDHYRKCPNCYRHFDPKAAERHFPFCEEKFKRLRASMDNAIPLNATSAALLEREERRRNYKAPILKKRSLTPFLDSTKSLEAKFMSKLHLRSSSIVGSSKLPVIALPGISEVKDAVNHEETIPKTVVPLTRRICKKCHAIVEQEHARFCQACGYKLYPK